MCTSDDFVKKGLAIFSAATRDASCARVNREVGSRSPRQSAGGMRDIHDPLQTMTI
jgi:hypothetical protein